LANAIVFYMHWTIKREFSGYCTVKNFGGQKVWQKGLLQGIGKKNFGKY